MASQHRTLVHEPEYDDAVVQLEQIPRIDRILVMLTFYIACDAEVFDVVPDSEIPGMRVAPSRALGPIGQELSIYFTIEGSSVRLWYVILDEEAEEIP